MLNNNSEHVCDYCKREFERFIPHSHIKSCRFSLLISKYYGHPQISDILDSLDDGFIESVNNGIVRGGEEGWDIYEKMMKICIEKFLPLQFNNNIIRKGLNYCYQMIINNSINY